MSLGSRFNLKPETITPDPDIQGLPSSKPLGCGLSTMLFPLYLVGSSVMSYVDLGLPSAARSSSDRFSFARCFNSFVAKRSITLAVLNVAFELIPYDAKVADSLDNTALLYTSWYQLESQLSEALISTSLQAY